MRHPFSESLYYQNGTLACPDYDHSNVSVGDTHTLKKIYDTAIRIDICWAHLYSKMLSRGDNCLSTGDYCHLKYSLFLQCRPLPEIKQYSLLFGKGRPVSGQVFYAVTYRMIMQMLGVTKTMTLKAIVSLNRFCRFSTRRSYSLTLAEVLGFYTID